MTRLDFRLIFYSVLASPLARAMQCSEVRECFSSRLMKDAQIDAFTKFMDAENRGHLYQECQIVKEYKNSGRRPYKATELCNLSEMERALEE